MLATAVKHEWEKDSPVLTLEVNGAVLQNDWSMGKHRLVNVFSVQCDRDTAVNLFSPQGANFTPGKIVMETFYRTQLFGHLNDANFVAKEPVLPKGTSRKRKAKSAQSTQPAGVEFHQLQAVPPRQTVPFLDPNDFDKSIDYGKALTSQVNASAASEVGRAPTRTHRRRSISSATGRCSSSSHGRSCTR